MAGVYRSDLAELDAKHLIGFCEGWRRPLTPDQHLTVLRGSRHVVLAREGAAGPLVGFITALGDGCQAAFMPLLAVLPAWRGQGLGTALLQRMLALLAAYPCIDLTCDPALQPFYVRCGLRRSVGMVVRRY
ncbi:MAG: GNAT family N-acetyltransferase [Fimbriimonadaceae bacterium]|nr:GNAT family N-acetyltransferase [Fimbriimonadaceae bacterium]